MRSNFKSKVAPVHFGVGKADEMAAILKSFGVRKPCIVYDEGIKKAGLAEGAIRSPPMPA